MINYNSIYWIFVSCLEVWNDIDLIRKRIYGVKTKQVRIKKSIWWNLKISFKTPQHSKNYYLVSYELLEKCFLLQFMNIISAINIMVTIIIMNIYLLKETHQQNRNKWMESDTIHSGIFVNIILLIYFGYRWIIVRVIDN